MDEQAIIDRWLAAPAADTLQPAVLRLSRRLPDVQERLAPRLEDPLHRALAGVGPAPAPEDESTLDRAVLAGQATVEAGGHLDLDFAASLEERAEGNLTWWVPAVRLHVRSNPAREHQARTTLADQVLPYVFPGEIHPLQVEALAVADRIMSSLHIDWANRLTKFLADALVLDARCLGFWFWPHLGFISVKRLVRPLGQLTKARRLVPGGLGMGAAYLERIGESGAALLAEGDEMDALVTALAIASTRPRG